MELGRPACIGILVPPFIGSKILSHLRTLHLSFVILQIGDNYDDMNLSECLLHDIYTYGFETTAIQH